jgi:hypothetical protein
MRWIHSVRWLVVCGVCAGAIATACGGDGDTSAGPTGSAGKEASAGNGSGNDNGNGDAGATPQGTGGTSSHAGSGTGGTAPAAGAGNEMGGEGSGTAGAPASAHVDMCQEACKKDLDCADGFKCLNSRCTSSATPMTCTSDDICRAELSGWTTECNEQSDCLLTEVCVDIGEKMGRCATKAGGVVSCKTLQQDEVATKDFDGKDATVCGKARAECGPEGACRERCAKDSCPTNFACNETSGACECDNDKACAGQPNVSKCEAGRCVCASDGDCKTNANKCSDGVCGCGDASVCTAKTVNPGTTWVCE